MIIRPKIRQITVLPTPSTVSGVAVTVGTEAAATQTNLAIDTAVSDNPLVSATGLAPPPGPTSTAIPTHKPSASTASPGIPISTVLAVCIGAFIFVTLIIIVALWIYKRAGKKASSRTRYTNPPQYRNRSARSDAKRPRSRQDHWGRLGGSTDESETHYPPSQTREMDKVNLTSFSMFKKSSSSVHSFGSFANTTAESRIDLEPVLFSQYHPQVGGGFAVEPPAKDFMGRLDVVSPMSWGMETIGKDSHFSSTSSSNAVKAIPTPAVISHGEPHRWESAQVEHFDEDDTNDNDNGGARQGRPHSTRSAHSSLFEERRARRSSPDSPFFGGGIRDSPSRHRARSRTRGEKTNVHSTANPFSDPGSPPPTLELTQHQPEDNYSNEDRSASARTLQSLIAALEGMPDDEEGSQRIQSLQPSVFSVSPSDDADITSVSAFPLPPT